MATSLQEAITEAKETRELFDTDSPAVIVEYPRLKMFGFFLNENCDSYKVGQRIKRNGHTATVKKVIAD
jgi:hypothetical protein